MTTGIYKLTFTSGMIYIGKSINIGLRWKQHFDKFEKGTASAKMQREFNIFGYPLTEVVYECHADHIDFVEAAFINSFTRVGMLNSTFPVRIPDGDVALINDHQEAFQVATFDHIRFIIDSNKEIVAMQDEISDLREQLLALDEVGIVMPDQIRTKNNSLTKENKELIKDNKRLSIEAGKSWWQRLFS